MASNNDPIKVRFVVGEFNFNVDSKAYESDATGDFYDFNSFNDIATLGIHREKEKDGQEFNIVFYLLDRI